MKKITVGYLDLSNKRFISNIEITRNFFDPLKRYARVKIIPVAKLGRIEGVFKKLKRYNLDYLYIDVFNFLLPSFLLREKLGLDIPLILTLHSVFYWADGYAKIVPLIRKYDIIIAPCVYAKESFLKISDKFDIRVVPYFLDMKLIQSSRAARFKGSGDKVITFMGRLTEGKGVGALIRCMPDIISKVGNARLDIIGPLSADKTYDHPKSAYVKKLEQQIRRLKLTERVHFKGAMFGTDKYRILSEADIFVNPTLAPEEVFPIVNMEAMACGVPVISTDWAGNGELVTSGRNGYLLKTNYGKNKKPEIANVQLISSAVKVLKNERLASALRRNALKTAQRFDYRISMPKFVKLLKKRGALKIENKWRMIKNKRIIDFAPLFSRDFLFFLYCKTHFTNETYDVLYKTMFKAGNFGHGHRLERKQKKSKSGKVVKIMDKIGRNLSDFLLSRAL